MDLVDYIRKNQKTHVIFDFDATLFLLVLPWTNWLEDLKRHLVEIDANIWDEYEQGMLNVATMQNEYIKNHGIVVKKFLEEHSASFEIEQLERYEPNTDLLAILDKLDDIEKFVWSSNARPVIEMVLNETGLADRFKKIISKQEVEFIKPKPDGFNIIYDEKVPKSAYLMVGDSVHDREAAEAAGIDFYLTDFFHLK